MKTRIHIITTARRKPKKIPRALSKGPRPVLDRMKPRAQLITRPSTKTKTNIVTRDKLTTYLIRPLITLIQHEKNVILIMPISTTFITMNSSL